MFHGLFKIAINAAIDEEILTRNRFTKVVIKGESETSRETNKYENITNYTFLFIAIYTGMRKGEICGLQWENIDFKNSTITVERTRDDVGARSPKTKNSYRTILVDRIVMEQLKKYQLWRKQILLKNGEKIGSRLYGFTNEHNNLLNGATIHKMFKDTN